MEEEMAARDILNLDNALAPRLIRCLYTAALILITVMVVLGVVRGVRIMSLPPLLPAVMANSAPAPAAPDAAAPPQSGMMDPGMNRRMMMDRRFGRRPMGPMGFGPLPMRNPMLAGIIVIFGTLLRGAIILMIVRILAEIGLAILAMQRRTEP